MMKRITLLLICIVCFVYTAKSSECYDYHTPNYYKVFVKNSEIIFQYTVKDPNEVSYVSQENVVLKNINSTSFKILSEDTNDILFSSIDGYFIAHKNISQVREDGVRKIGSFEDINESIGLNFFCINNQWKYIEAGSYTHQNLEKILTKMPSGLEMITDFPSRKILLKNSKNVFYFDTENFTFHKIKGLTGRNTRFFQFKNRYRGSDAFLYDKDTFYKISVHEIEDFTSEFINQQATISFENLIISQIGDRISLDTGDGMLWLYKENGMFYKSYGSIYFVRKEASYLNKYREFIVFNNKLYNDFYDLIKNGKAIDFSLVKNKDEFHRESEFFYSDGLYKYHYDYESKMMQPIQGLTGNDQFYDKINTYGYGNNRCYIGDTKIHVLSAGIEADAVSISYASGIKDVRLAIAYDDKIYIDNKSIPNIADRTTMSLLGSTVDVISRCDGGKGQYPIVTHVYYFFKDKDNIYVYNTNNPKMRVIKNLNIKDYEEDNYGQLMHLMKMTLKNQKKG